MDTIVTRDRLEAAVIEATNVAGDTVMQWGKDDCALWVANIHQRVLGYDPGKSFRGRYKTRNGARRAMGAAGLLGAIKAAARRHKWKRIDPTWARPGDVGLAWTIAQAGAKQVPVLATVVCRSPGWFVGRNERGFTALRSNVVVYAWSVLDDNRTLVSGSPVFLPRLSMRPGEAPTSAVAHEPISAAIGLSALIGSLLGVSGAVAGAIGGFIVSAAISVGVSLISSMLQPQRGNNALSSSGHSISDTSTIRGAQITERQPIPIKRVIVGEAYVGGALSFEQVKPPYLTMQVLLNWGEIDSVRAMYVGSNRINFAADIAANTVMFPVAAPGQPNYPETLVVSFRYGTDGQAVDPLILQDYPNVGADFRQRGIATGTYRFGFGADQAEFIALWGQVSRPNVYNVIRGVRVYDPRDPTQDMNDPTTWRWSQNATLIQIWYLTRPWGGRIPMSRVRWDKIIVSSNYDDEGIGTNDGEIIKRHTIDGVITLNQRPYEVLQDLMTANRALLLETGGYYWIESSRPKTPIATIHDRILASGIKYTAARQKSELVNKCQVRFVSPDQEYQLVDGPILDRTDFQALDQEPLPATLALKYTTDHRRAQRLQKAFLLSSRLGRSISCSVDVKLMAVADDELIGSVLTVDSQLFSQMNGTYMVTGVGFADDCSTLSLALVEYDETIERDWNPETDEQPFTLVAVDVS